jgi:hypothetical protein
MCKVILRGAGSPIREFLYVADVAKIGAALIKSSFKNKYLKLSTINL